jgi:hypothetical protein
MSAMLGTQAKKKTGIKNVDARYLLLHDGRELQFLDN